MRTAILSLSCFLAAGVVFSQQTAPAASPTKPAMPGAAAIQTGPLHPLTDAQAAKILEIMGGNKMKDEVKSGMTSYFHSRLPFAPQDVNDDLEQSLAKMDLDAPLVAIYKQHISTEDADAIIAFYKTPAGKEMIDAMPEIQQQSQVIGVQLGRKTAQEVVDRHRPEIEAAAKQYQQEHAPRPAPSLNRAPQSAPDSSSPAKPGSPATTTTPQPPQ